MFAYCRNNPVRRVDASGRLDLECESNSDNLVDTTRADWANGGDVWSLFSQSLHDAVNGLNMAMGNKGSGFSEYHHIFSNKNKTYTPLYEAIVRKYDMSLEDPENIINLKGHHGRHTNVYHDFMLVALEELDTISAGDTKMFREGLLVIVSLFYEFPWLPYAR
jgi:hypothetical protein